jgi:hypothetical protein
VLGGSSENAQRQYAGDEEDLLLQYAIRQSLDTDTTASEQVQNLHVHTYMMHGAMSPVLHVEGLRTLLGSVVVRHQLSGSLVAMYLWLSTCPLYFSTFSIL